MGSPDSVAGLSSKCNRALPVCQRCSTLVLDCIYPKRQQRKSKPKPPALLSHDQSSLAALLERLERVEARTSVDAQTEKETPVTRINVLRHHALSNSSPGFNTIPGPSPSCQSYASPSHAESPWATGCDEPEYIISEETSDITSILGSAVKHVQRLRKRRFESSKSLVAEEIKISPDRAKLWVKNYFAHLSPKLNPPLKDRRLLDLLPDLLVLDHVHVDACMLLIYYCIIGQGCFFDDNNGYTRPDPQTHRQIYVSCLRTISTWQNEATGSMTDLIAAILMTQTAAENLDFGLSWQMHKLACEYAQDLHLHNLDDEGTMHPANRHMSDADRVNMWNLVQLDLFYRLVNNKPPAFISNLDNWRVNFPWLSSDSPPEQDEAVQTIVFLARSRITLIIINFFQAIERLGEGEDTLSIIEPLCMQVEHVFQDWKIGDWLDVHSRDTYSRWSLSELALSCYACILFMLRKATLSSSNGAQPLQDTDTMIPRSALSMRAARKLVDFLYHMVHTWQLPGPEALSTALGTYRAHVAYAHLASGVRDGTDVTTVWEDLTRMRNFTKCVQAVASTEKEFTPLARALDSVYQKVLAQVNGVIV